MKTTIRFVLLTCLSALLVACSGEKAEPAPTSNEEQLAPTVELLNLDNETLNTATIDKPILYSFWASWCNYCQEEIPQINELYAQYGNEVEFVSVNITHNDSLNGAKQFISDKSLTMPVYFDIDGIASTKFGVLAVPTIVLVDRDGNFVERKVGPSNDGDVERITQSLKDVVEGS
ncbi:MAG: TlpA disulfide reductase family protein [Solibacillus sp.]